MTEVEGKKLAPGDMIELNEIARDWTRGHPFKVAEVKAWGVICWTESESAVAFRTKGDGRAYYRAKWNEIVGRGEQQTLATGAGHYPD